MHVATFPVKLRKTEMGTKRKKQEAKEGNGKKQEENGRKGKKKERKWRTSGRCGVEASTGRDEEKAKTKRDSPLRGGDRRRLVTVARRQQKGQR